MEWLIGLLIMFLVLFLSLWIKERTSRRDESYRFMLDREERDRKLNAKDKVIEVVECQRDYWHQLVLKKELDSKTADKKITQEEK